MKCILLDFSRTLYNPETDSIIDCGEELLEELHGKTRLFLLSKNPAGRRERAEELVGKWFEKMFFVEEKDLEGLRKILKEENLNPEDCLMAGDRAVKEIALGKELGMKTVWVRQGKFEDEIPLNSREPDFTVRNLKELKHLLTTEVGL